MSDPAERQRQNEIAKRQRERDRALRAAEAAWWAQLQAELRRPGFPKRTACLKCGRAMTSPAPDVRLCNGCRAFQEAAARGIDMRLLERGPGWEEW